MALQWRHVDMLNEVFTIDKDKNGQPLRMPFNAAARAVLVEMATRRQRPHDPTEPVFPQVVRYDRVFARAVRNAQNALGAAGQLDEAARLDGVTRHGLRHSWASRASMAGVDPLTLKMLGGWKSLAMVERYSHLSPAHLRAAVAKLVPTPASAPNPIAVLAGQQNLNTLPRIAVAAAEVGRNWDSEPADLTPASEDAC